jgi:hypothetical protein
VLLLFNLEDLAGVAHSMITLGTHRLVAHATSVCLGNSVGRVGDELRIANGAERGCHCIAVGLIPMYEIRFTECKKIFCFLTGLGSLKRLQPRGLLLRRDSQLR